METLKLEVTKDWEVGTQAEGETILGYYTGEGFRCFMYTQSFHWLGDGKCAYVTVWRQRKCWEPQEDGTNAYVYDRVVGPTELCHTLGSKWDSWPVSEPIYCESCHLNAKGVSTGYLCDSCVQQDAEKGREEA